MQFPNQKHSLIVKFSRLFNSFCNVRGTDHKISKLEWLQTAQWLLLFRFSSAAFGTFSEFSVYTINKCSPNWLARRTLLSASKKSWRNWPNFNLRLKFSQRTEHWCDVRVLFLNCTGYSILSLSLYSVTRKRKSYAWRFPFIFREIILANLDDKIFNMLGALIFSNSLFKLLCSWTLTTE